MTSRAIERIVVRVDYAERGVGRYFFPGGSGGRYRRLHSVEVVEAKGAIAVTRDDARSGGFEAEGGYRCVGLEGGVGSVGGGEGVGSG